VHSALFVTLLAIAASLLIAAAQGPGTIEPAISERPTQPPVAIGDAGLRPLPTPSPTLAPAIAGTGDEGATDLAPTSKRPEKLTGYQWPLSRKARITAFYDWRDDGFLAIDGKRFHEGLDMTTSCGDDVHAAHAGTVRAAGRRFDNEMGFSEPMDAFYERLQKKGRISDLPIVVVIDDGNGYRSAYVHLRDATVKTGDKVKAGDLIGHIGDTGNADGCHLHYELIRMDGGWMNVAKERVKADRYPATERERVDPLRVLDLRDKDAPRITPGVVQPKDPPRLPR
jgi:murein DD-endopeptidase MepM/ murein hydrolase activator NlpD